MNHLLLVALVLTTGAAMALETDPKGEGPPGRELTKLEQFMRSQRGQELDILIDTLMRDDIDRDAADRAIQEYRRKYNITAPVGTLPNDSQPGLPSINLR